MGADHGRLLVTAPKHARVGLKQEYRITEAVHRADEEGVQGAPSSL